MNVSITPAEDDTLITNLFQYYLYDMSEYTGFQPDASGSFAVDNSVTGLLDYWQEPNHFPYLIRVNEELAGFALVRQFPQGSGQYDMGQFFVMRKFKRQGVGSRAFQLCVARHPGPWQTRVLPDNTGALAFWKKTIGEVCGNNVQIKSEPYRNRDMLFIRYVVPVGASSAGL